MVATWPAAYPEKGALLGSRASAELSPIWPTAPPSSLADLVIDGALSLG